MLERYRYIELVVLCVFLLLRQEKSDSKESNIRKELGYHRMRATLSTPSQLKHCDLHCNVLVCVFHP